MPAPTPQRLPARATPTILSSFDNFEEPLPLNPEGVARLEEAAVTRPPAARTAAPRPAAARRIPGQTFVFESNPAQLDIVSFLFDETGEATGRFGISGGAPTLAWSMGLDAVYRFSPGLDGRPLALRGAWTGPETFVLDYNGVTFNDQMVVHFRFQDESVAITLSETEGGPGVHAEGRLQQPLAAPA